jgi:hypothetical protein
MKVALAISHGRVAPCFAGVPLCVVDDDASTKGDARADLRDAEAVATEGWHPLAWGRELMRRDVGLLLCAGIAPGTWAATQGHGIKVIPDAMGEADAVLAAWRSGHLTPPQMWPVTPNGGDALAMRGSAGGGRRRRRFHGGRG